MESVSIFKSSHHFVATTEARAHCPLAATALHKHIVELALKTQKSNTAASRAARAYSRALSVLLLHRRSPATRRHRDRIQIMYHERKPPSS